MNFDTLGLALSDALQPIYLVDQGGLILFANQALADWLEVDLADLVGKQTAYHGGASDDRTSRGVLGICPPPSALEGQRQQATVSCVERKGGVRHRRGEFWPLALSEASGHAVLAILQPNDMTRDELAASLNPSPQPDELHRLLAQQRSGQAARLTTAGIVGQSAALGLVRTQIQAAAASRASVLLRGHVATELRVLAETIHYAAHPSGQAELLRLESPLARPDDLRKTLTEGRSGAGTLLVEQVAELTSEQQAELSAAISSAQWKWQVVATTLRSSSETAELAPSLRARLATIEIYLPPLAERLEDLPLVAQWHVENLNRDSAKQVEGFTDDALDRLALYDWPGGVPELQSVVAIGHAACQGPRIESSDLPRLVRHAVSQAQLLRDRVQPIDLDAYLAQVESLVVNRALELAGGNKAEAARLLGVSRPRLYRKLEQMGLLEPATPRPAKPSRPPSHGQAPSRDEADEIEFLPVDGPSGADDERPEGED